MSAAGRLWQRSGIWRCLIGLTVSATVLAVLYPPQPPPSAAFAAHYTPLTTASILGPSYRAVATVAGRIVPLPSGSWNAIQAMKGSGNVPPTFATSYVRLEGDRLTGIVIAEGTVMPSDMPHRFARSPACSQADAYRAATIASDDLNRDQCWGIVPLDPSRDWGASARQPDRDLIIRLHEGGVLLPPEMVLAEWSDVTDRSWYRVQYAFALPAAEAGRKAAFVAGLVDWATAWTPLLQQGDDNRLTAASVLQADRQYSR